MSTTFAMPNSMPFTSGAQANGTGPTAQAVPMPGAAQASKDIATGATICAGLGAACGTGFSAMVCFFGLMSGGLPGLVAATAMTSVVWGPLSVLGSGLVGGVGGAGAGAGVFGLRALIAKVKNWFSGAQGAFASAAAAATPYSAGPSNTWTATSTHNLNAAQGASARGASLPPPPLRMSWADLDTAQRDATAAAQQAAAPGTTPGPAASNMVYVINRHQPLVFEGLPKGVGIKGIQTMPQPQNALSWDFDPKTSALTCTAAPFATQHNGGKYFVAVTTTKNEVFGFQVHVT